MTRIKPILLGMLAVLIWLVICALFLTVWPNLFTASPLG